MAQGFQNLPGFRDFDPYECQKRNYLFETWRSVAKRYGFVEYETPLLEATELYLKKSGGELTTQLFRFQDQGERDVTLRPEVTASLARLAISKQRDYPKPLRWFEIGQCFRYESPQKGRTREFYQFNTDILGASSPASDAELIALSIDTMRALGFDETHFKARLSDREVWQKFAEDKEFTPEQLGDLLAIIDKLGRDKPEVTEERLSTLGLKAAEIETFISDPASYSEAISAVLSELEARGLADFVEVDLSIVRGLAYYTGVVFEIFDVQKSLRAVAGGGRYDKLISTLSNGKVDMPAVGFAMGDVVIGHFIEETPAAAGQYEAWRQRNRSCDLYVVIDDEEKRPEALNLIQNLRNNGFAVDFPLEKTKFDKQIKTAAATLAPFALVVGSKFPKLTLRNLTARAQESIAPNTDIISFLKKRLSEPEGPLLA